MTLTIRQAILRISVLGTCFASADAAVRHVPGDYPTIQAAVDAAVAGDVIQLGKGTFTENVLVENRTDLEFRGLGKKSIWFGDSDFVPALRITGCSRILVTKIEFRAIDQAVNVRASAYVVVDRCRFIDCLDQGISLAATDHSTVRRSEFRWSAAPTLLVRQYGVQFSSFNNDICQDCVVADNEFRNSGRAIGETVGTLRTTIVGNDIRDGEFGITPASEGIVMNNRLLRLTRNGISSQGPGVSILDNEVRDVAEEGIRVAAADQIVARNSVTKAATGIRVSNGNANLFENVVSKSVGDGIQVNTAALAAVLVGNSVEKAGASGIHLEGAGHILIANTALKSSAFDLNDEAAPGANTYSGNEFSVIAP